jgi:hypothetical protein
MVSTGGGSSTVTFASSTEVSVLGLGSVGRQQIVFSHPSAPDP